MTTYCAPALFALPFFLLRFEKFFYAIFLNELEIGNHAHTKKCLVSLVNAL